MDLAYTDAYWTRTQCARTCTYRRARTDAHGPRARTYIRSIEYNEVAQLPSLVVIIKAWQVAWLEKVRACARVRTDVRVMVVEGSDCRG